MAPSTSLQSRINLFESFESSGINHSNLDRGLRPLPLRQAHKLGHQHIIDSDLPSPNADSLFPTPQIQPVLTPSRPSSPPALGRKTSLIDFSELPPPKLTPGSEERTESTTLPASTIESPARPHVLLRTTPLPPRKPVSPEVIPTTQLTTPPLLPKRHVSSPVAMTLSQPSNNPSSHNDLDSHTYPPRSPRQIASPGFQRRHGPSSSTSSSLSSDGGDARNSLDGSYESVSPVVPSKVAVSTLYDWEDDFQLTSKMPQRQQQKQGTSSPIIGPVAIRSTVTTCRPPPPPPPPPRQQQQLLVGSLSPQPTTSIRHRPAPLPPKARKRYDALFERNLPQGQCNGRRVDLLTNGEDCDLLDHPSREGKLDGTVVKHIWLCSKLPRARLREIWAECDPNGLGSLDREAFARGMWRIDEALSHAHQQTPLLASKANIRVPPPPLRKPTLSQQPASLIS